MTLGNIFPESVKKIKVGSLWPLILVNRSRIKEQEIWTETFFSDDSIPLFVAYPSEERLKTLARTKSNLRIWAILYDGFEIIQEKYATNIFKADFRTTIFFYVTCV